MTLGTRMRLIMALVGISLPGIFMIAWQLPAMMAPFDAELPPGSVLILVSALQSLVLVIASAAVGAWVAPKVNLCAPALEGAIKGDRVGTLLVRQARVGLPVGIILGISIVTVEFVVFRAHLPATLFLLDTPMTPGYLLAALTYGGVVEEVLMRWGVMSFLSWLIYLALGRRFLGQALLIGNALAAILFAVGHFPIVIVLAGELTMPIVWRTLLLNGVPGLIFGLLYQRRGLEAAMFAHMGAHLGMAVPRFIFGA